MKSCRKLFTGVIFFVVIMLADIIIVRAEEFKDGLIPESERIQEEHLVDNDDRCMRTVLPKSVDLSTSQYFPEIRTQGQIGSCSAFSIVYYQYTYEVNKMNNLNSKFLSNCYSPKWAYNALNKGVKKGVGAEKVYEFLKEHGSLKWNDFVYDGVDYTSLPNDINKMREALRTRVLNWYSYRIPASGTVINGPNDKDLDYLKSLLNEGKMLRISTYFQWDVVNSNEWKNVAIRCTTKTSGHSMVIVGYNDDVWVDVNGNNIKDEGECGAFKIANSWGLDYANNGFIWVLYDALNGKTSINGNWEEQYSGTRIAAFAFSTESKNNYFNWIDVENKNIGFVSEINFSADPVNKLQIKLGKSKGTVNTMENSHNITYLDHSQPTSYTGTMVYDLGTIINKEYTGYKWYLNIGSSGKISNISYKITDDLGNIVGDVKNLNDINGSTIESFILINLKKGDVNYSGTVNTSDALRIERYLKNEIDLSNVQKFLADYDGDGKVTHADAEAILKSTLGKIDNEK